MRYTVTRNVVKCDKCQKEIETDEFYEVKFYQYSQKR